MLTLCALQMLVLLLLLLLYKIPNRTDFSVFNCRYSAFFGIPNTDVGIGICLLNIGYRFGIFGMPTHD